MLPSYAHDDEAVERTAAGFDQALAVVGRAVRVSAATENPDDRSVRPRGPRAAFARGYLESLRLEHGTLRLSGWTLLDRWAPERTEIVTEDGISFPATVVNRSDLVEAFPAVAFAQSGGFEAAIPVPRSAWDGPIRLTLRLVRGEFVDFQCSILIESRPDANGAWPGTRWMGDGFLVV